NTAASLSAYFTAVSDKGLAIFASEYGAVAPCPTPPGACTTNALPAVQGLFAYAVPHQIGRVLWHWWGGGNDLTTAGGGWQATYDMLGQANNLSSCLGQATWSDNHGLIPMCR